MASEIIGRTDFRKDINALRAIAVLSVLLFHYKVPSFAGGFAGVDIFFVISGYLMSRIIIRAVEKHQFSYWDYFQKRLKRIVPALIFLVITVTVATLILYFPDEFKRNQRNAASSVLFFSNIFYLNNSNYFHPSSDTNLFLHTWSLSVEWQFYLIYPVILLFLSKICKTRRQLLIVLAGLSAAIFIATVIYSGIDPTSSFYLLPTRSWELLAGGIAFLTEPRVSALKYRKVFAVGGYAMLFGCLFFLDSSMTWPGVFTLIPVAGTFLIIAANDQRIPVIDNAVVQWIGKISYSVYLWHWPLFVIAQYYGIGNTFPEAILMTVAALLSGYLSFRYIESMTFNTGRPIMYAMGCVFAGTFLLGRVTINDVFYKENTLKIEAYSRTHEEELEKQFLKDICHVSTMDEFDTNQCMCIKPEKINILLLGDSHMGQLSQSLRKRFRNKNINFLQATGSNTLPTLKNYQGKDAKVWELMRYVLYDFIPKNAREIDGVIISGNWAGKNDLTEKQIVSTIRETIKYLKRFGINSLVIGQTERYSVPYTTIAARDYENNTLSAYTYLDTKAYQVDSYLKKNLKKDYISIINKKNIPKLSPRLEPYMQDNHHVTGYGADLIVDKVIANPVADDFFGEENLTQEVAELANSQ